MNWSKMINFNPDTNVIKKFLCWLEQFDQRHARSWGKLYNAAPEAAMCEAMYWGVMSDCGVSVEPNADLDGGKAAPDFVCSKDGYKFYLEVTCIQIDTATEYTSLEHLPEYGASWYSPLNIAICNEVQSKTLQCANLDAPCILGIGTFHYQASALCVDPTFIEWLLTGESSIAFDVDTRLGKAVGRPYETTTLKSAAFVRPNNLVGIEPTRQTISTLIIAGFGFRHPNIYGAIHPYPVREFDSTILDRIPFCRLKSDIQNARIGTEWTRDPELEKSL